MKKFLESVKEALHELVILQTITTVGDVSVTIEDRDVKEISVGDGNAAMVTRFNMLTGDITNSYDKQFVTGDYQSLQQFQLDREKQGFERVKANIEALQNLIKLAEEVDEQLKNQPADTTDPTPPANTETPT